jgi:hypothetical protein
MNRSFSLTCPVLRRSSENGLRPLMSCWVNEGFRFPTKVPRRSYSNARRSKYYHTFVKVLSDYRPSSSMLLRGNKLLEPVVIHSIHLGQTNRQMPDGNCLSTFVRGLTWQTKAVGRAMRLSHRT